MAAVLEKTVPKTANNGNGVKPHLITVAEYDRMIEAGIYTENDRLELLNGEIVEIVPKGSKHAYYNERIADLFKGMLGKNSDVRSQNPVILDDFSEPEPDIVLAQPPRENYFDKHPTPADILLVMEISDTTLAYDRADEAEAYSRNGIAQYLLLNLKDETVEDYRQPNADGYGSKQPHRRGDKFNLDAFPEIEIKIEELL